MLGAESGGNLQYKNHVMQRKEHCGTYQGWVVLTFLAYDYCHEPLSQLS